MKKTTWPGNWKVVCDVCGFWFPSGEVKHRWDGLIVCPEDWETRHPQTLYGYKAHTSVPDFIRDEPEDTFIFICPLEALSGYTGLATVGCAKVGNNQFTYDFLVGLSEDGH